MLPHWIIEKKRDGQALSEEEIRFFVDGFTRGDIPDYQMSAMAMAIFFQGMDLEETAILTDAMMRSGDVVDTSSIDKPKVDKHSTGGIGDKVSLILAPLLACCDVAVPMISGRGLGITGGTLDKLESIPGFRTDLDDREFVSVVAACGCAISGQTGQLAPADKKLYALRDVTATVPSIPLIVASIMSKKLAEGIDSLVLDVKWGSGAFMKTVEQARELARNLVEVGRRMRKNMGAIITDMNQPLGCSAGNAVEVIETVEALAGRGPDDLMEVTMSLAAQMCMLAGKADEHVPALAMLHDRINSGAALERFQRMVELQGGNPGIVDNYSLLPTAPIQRDYTSPQDGYLARVDAEQIGRACIVLGAGRRRTEDQVDHAVGVTQLRKLGDSIEKDSRLLTLHARNEESLAEAIALLNEAFEFSTEPVPPTALITDTISPRGS